MPGANGRSWVSVVMVISWATLCTAAVAQVEERRELTRAGSIVVSSSTPSVILRPGVREATFTIQGTGLDKIKAARIVDRRDAVVSEIKVVSHALTKDLAAFTLAAKDSVTSGDYFVELVTDREVTTLPLHVVIQDLDHIEVQPDYDIRIRFPVHLSQISDEVMHAKVDCHILAGVNAFIGSGESKIQLTNGAFDGTVNVDCSIADEFLPQDAKWWSCALYLVVPHDTMGTLAKVPSQSAVDSAGNPTGSWARAASDAPFTNRVKCFRNPDDPNSTFANPSTLSCDRQP